MPVHPLYDRAIDLLEVEGYIPELHINPARPEVDLRWHRPGGEMGHRVNVRSSCSRLALEEAGSAALEWCRTH